MYDTFLKLPKGPGTTFYFSQKKIEIYNKIYLAIIYFLYSVVFLMSTNELGDMTNVYFDGYKFFKFPWDLDFFTQNLDFISNNNNLENCPLCDYEPNNVNPNSTPRDVVLSYASGRVSNVALFVRTLRTSKSKCSIVLLFDKRIINSLSSDEKKMLSKCGVQIIQFDPLNNPGVYPKSYAFQLFESFIRHNVHKINRIIICDLFDFLFQGDPFHQQLPKNEVHIVDEGEKLGGTGEAPVTNRKWILKFDPHYKITSDDLEFYYYCSGYMEATANLMVQFLNVYLSVVPMSRMAYDQGGFNYIYIAGLLKKYSVPVAKSRDFDYVAHTGSNPIRNATFPNVKTIQNPNVTAICVHHYYHASDFFLKSLVKVCPRPSSAYHNYLSKHANLKLPEIERELGIDMNQRRSSRFF